MGARPWKALNRLVKVKSSLFTANADVVLAVAATVDMLLEINDDVGVHRPERVRPNGC